MRKVCAVLLALGMALCAVGASAQTPSEALGMGARVAVLDMGFPVEEALGFAAQNKLEGAIEPENIGSVVSSATLAEAVAMLTAGGVDAVFTFEDAGRYFAEQDAALTVVTGLAEVSFHLIAKADNGPLIDQINKALAAMRDDATLENLEKNFIDAVLEGVEPVVVEAPYLDGQETLRVGVSGDLPPMDYVTAEGVPAGFNTAVIAEIAARTGMNVEWVVLESSVRLGALEAGEIDVFFWNPDFAALATGENLEAAEEAFAFFSLEGAYVLSEAYHSCALAWLLRAQ